MKHLFFLKGKVSQTLFFILIGVLLFNLIGCPQASSPASTTQGNPTTSEPSEEEHKYISISLGRACESPNDISSYIYSDFYDSEEFGVANGYYYGLQLIVISEGFASLDYSFSLAIEGNVSSDTFISENTIHTLQNGEFYQLHVAADETAKTIKVNATCKYHESIKGTLTLEVCEKFDRDNLLPDLSFDKKTYISKEDVYYIRDVLCNNSETDYNLDFTNCVFELNEIPYSAFCTISSDRDFVWDDNIDSTLLAEGALANLKSVILPDSITRIEDNAFGYCYNMGLEKLPLRLKSLGKNSFIYCKSITINTIPDSVIRLDLWVFYRCYNLREISLSNKLEWFRCGIFAGCNNLQTVRIPKSVSRIDMLSGRYYFDFIVDEDNENYKSENGILYSKDGKNLYKIPSSKVGNSYSIPDSITKITQNALDGLENLTTLYIPSSVTEMEESAITACVNLKNIYVDLSEKPEGWDDNWLSDFSEEGTISFAGTIIAHDGADDNDDNDEDFEYSLSGIYTISNNSSAQLNFNNGTLEFIYNGLTHNTYSYELSDSVLYVTLPASQGSYTGEFDIVQTSTGYNLKKRNDVGVSQKILDHTF